MKFHVRITSTFEVPDDQVNPDGTVTFESGRSQPVEDYARECIVVFSNSTLGRLRGPSKVDIKAVAR